MWYLHKSTNILCTCWFLFLSFNFINDLILLCSALLCSALLCPALLYSQYGAITIIIIDPYLRSDIYYRFCTGKIHCHCQTVVVYYHIVWSVAILEGVAKYMTLKYGMVWRVAVRYGALWCVLQYSMVWCVLPCGVVKYDWWFVLRLDEVSCDSVWFAVACVEVRYGIMSLILSRVAIRFGMVWCSRKQLHQTWNKWNKILETLNWPLSYDFLSLERERIIW